MRPGSRWGVLGQRNFRLLWTGETASGLGNGLTTVALPLVAVLVLQASSFAVGLLAAAVWLPWLVVGLPAGAWVDRLRKRPVMITCNCVSAVAYTSVPVAAWLDLLTLAQLFVVALVCGVASVFFNTAIHAYVPVVLSGRDLVDGNAKLQVSEAGTRVLGRGVAGFVAQLCGAVTGLLIDAATFVVSTVCLLGLRVREATPVAPAQRPNLAKEIGVGLRFVAHDPYMRSMASYGATVNLALMGYQAVQVVFLVRTVGVSTGAIGVLVMAASLGGTLGALLAAPLSRRWGTARAFLVMQVLSCPFALLLPLATPGAGLLLFGGGAFMLGVGIAVGNVIVGSFRQGYCPPEILGRVASTVMAINQGTISIGSVLGGLLSAEIGIRPTMWVMASLLAPCWLILYLGPMRRVRDLPQAYAPEPSMAASAD
ncbi:MFS transporter [Streptomyces sp. GbtcB6]|uniref:MFS transporter n=1 Tax=Streptomyces sp. GbtcB6 TaxID=2824751 RepID=UPI001C304559|nr:MFS transporter [Streptomyces sp. GbtcB6]